MGTGVGPTLRVQAAPSARARWNSVAASAWAADAATRLLRPPALRGRSGWLQTAPPDPGSLLRQQQSWSVQLQQGTQFQGHRAGACSASSSASSHTASRGGPSMSVTHTAIKIRNLISTTPRDVPTRSNSGFYDMRRSLSGGRSPLARGCPSQVGATIATSSVVIPNRGTVPPAASRSGTHSVCGLNSACGYSRGHSPKRAEQHCPD